MEKNKKLIVANWKMNPQTAEEALRLVKNIAGRAARGVELAIAPPFVYLDMVKKNCGREIKLAAQNVHWEERGAFTGEISAPMLKNIGCDYVIIGHSERRYKMGETGEMINLKIKSALRHGLVPILAVGEREKNGDIKKTLAEQLTGALEGVGASEIGRLVIAYEPVWAIGTGVSDTPDHALSAALLIRKIAGGIYGKELTENLPVLYGGSVSGKNTGEFIGQKGIDGALVGGASLEAENFEAVLASAVSGDAE